MYIIDCGVFNVGRWSARALGSDLPSSRCPFLLSGPLFPLCTFHSAARSRGVPFPREKLFTRIARPSICSGFPRDRGNERTQSLIRRFRPSHHSGLRESAIFAGGLSSRCAAARQPRTTEECAWECVRGSFKFLSFVIRAAVDSHFPIDAIPVIPGDRGNPPVTRGRRGRGGRRTTAERRS